MKSRRIPGFSLLELLIALLIFGTLAGVSAYVVNVARASSRDAKRISDVSVIRTGLNQYWLQKAAYPATAGVDLGRAGTNSDLLTVQGFSSAQAPGSALILQRVPTGPRTGEFYHYKASVNGYSLRFATERETAYGPAGVYYVHSTGVDQEDREK